MLDCDDVDDLGDHERMTTMHQHENAVLRKIRHLNPIVVPGVWIFFENFTYSIFSSFLKEILAARFHSPPHGRSFIQIAKHATTLPKIIAYATPNELKTSQK